MNEHHDAPGSPYLVGPPVLTKDGFYGRSEQIRDFFNRLNTPQMHCQRILGARRSGKTSFLRHVARPEVYRDRVRTAGLPVILAYVDLQADITEPLLFFREVALAIAAAAPEGKDIPVPSLFADVRSFDIWIDPVCQRFRVVVLLDEFEVLAQSERFDLDFFRKLRALASRQLVWGTASYRDVATLSKPPGTKDLASPLYNIFHSSPIYLGPLQSIEAEALVSQPAASRGVNFSNDEVSEIRQLAGDMPFLLQAASDIWFTAHADRIPWRDRCSLVGGQLLSSGNLVREQFISLWASLPFKAQRLLRFLAAGKDFSMSKEHGDILLDLENFGHLARRNGGLQLGGGLLQKWVRDFSDTTSGTPHVFIGHGHNPLWRSVRDLVEKEFGLIPECYEAESRASQSIVPILEKMIERADFAIVVVTGEDKTAEDSMRPRQNVVHEMGLFQGKLGFGKVLLLMQDGVDFPSNLAGMQLIVFKGDDIDSTFLKISAALRRENLLV